MKKFLIPKILVIFLTLFGFSLNASAQTGIFKEGDMAINAGVGIGTYISHETNMNTFSMTIPPITGSFEYCILDQLIDGEGSLGIGGYAGYILFRGKDKFTGGNGFNVGDFVIGPRGLFHYQFIDNLDTYAGIMLGYDIVSFSQPNGTAGSKFCPAFFVGARYYFTESFGVFSELGYGVSPLQLGFTYKF